MQSTVPWRREFLAGAIAAAAFLAVYFVARFIWQIPGCSPGSALVAVVMNERRRCCSTGLGTVFCCGSSMR